MPARVRAQISCEQTHSCDGNGEMNASSAFERQQRKFERKKKEKKKKDGTKQKNQIYLRNVILLLVNCFITKNRLLYGYVYLV